MEFELVFAAVGSAGDRREVELIDVACVDVDQVKVEVVYALLRLALMIQHRILVANCFHVTLVLLQRAFLLHAKR